MSALLAKLGLGRESFENPMDEVAEGYIATGEPEADTASAAILEATKESAEIDEDLATLDDTAEATNDIDEQVEIGEIAVEQNQYTPMLAMIQKTALKNALSKVSSRANAKAVVDELIMPAQETFDTSKGGTLAVENMKDTANELWASVKAQFKQIMDRIVQFFRNVFDAGTKLANRAEKLKAAKLKSAGGKVKPSGAGAIKVGNKLGDDAIKGFDIVVRAVNDALSESRLNAGHLVVAAGGVRDALIDFNSGEVPSELKSTAPEGATVTCTKEASGGVVFATIIGKSGEEGGEAKDSHNVIHKTAKEGTPEESDALTDAECSSVLSHVIEMAKVIGKGKELAKKLEGANKEFEKQINAASKKDKDEARIERAKFTGYVTFARRATAFRKDLTVLALAAGNGMCNYVEASCKAAKEEKKDDKKEEKKEDK